MKFLNIRFITSTRADDGNKFQIIGKTNKKKRKLQISYTSNFIVIITRCDVYRCVCYLFRIFFRLVRQVRVYTRRPVRNSYSNNNHNIYTSRKKGLQCSAVDAYVCAHAAGARVLIASASRRRRLIIKRYPLAVAPLPARPATQESIAATGRNVCLRAWSTLPPSTL